MSATQLILALFVGFGLLVGGYVLYRWGSHQLDQRYPKPVQLTPAAVLQPPLQVAPQPPSDWWDRLQALQTEVRGDLAKAQGAFRNARAAEERLRQKGYGLDDDDDQEPPPPRRVSVAQLQAMEDDWAPEEPAPVEQDAPSAQPVSRLTPAQLRALEQRRRMQ